MFKVRGIKKTPLKTINSKWSKNCKRYIGTTKIRRLKAGKGSLLITSPKLKGVQSYNVQYAVKKNKYVTAKSRSQNKKGQIKLTGLKKGTKYYIRIAPILKKGGYIGIYSSAKRSKKVK